MIMQAIMTRYLGPTNFRGSRIVAKCEAKRVTVSWDYSLNPEGNHKAAAMQLAALLGWEGTWVGGGEPQGCGYVFVNVERSFGMRFEVTIARASP